MSEPTRRTWGYALGLATLLLAGGCGGPLVKLASAEDWVELDRRARAQKQTPRGRAARAWAQALVELDKPEEARALLLRDFRSGGQELSLLALAELERELGLRGMAAAHYTRLSVLDLDTVQGAPEVEEICALLRARARAEAELGEALAADVDMRRLELWCPEAIDDEDRGFLSSVQPGAREQAEGRRSMEALAPTPEDLAGLEARLGEQLELARKRGPRAVHALAEAEGMQVEPDDVAVLLAAEFAGALGPGLISRQRLSGWIGDGEVADLLAAIDTLPDGVREYALLRLASARPDASGAGGQQGWIVAAMASVAGQGPHEAAKAWRVAAAAGDLGGAEFALNTNLRDMIPVDTEEQGSVELAPKSSHWSQRVPVDRRSFDLLLTLARLLEQRGKPVLALELRRAVLVAGYEIGLAQVAASAVDEVQRQLVLGHPWQALAIAEVVPGPLLDEILPAFASAVGLAHAAGLGETDRNVVWRAFGDPWFESWDPRVDAAMAGLDLADGARCPELARWLDPAADGELARVGLDALRSRAALGAAFEDLGAPATGVALAQAIESDLALSCSAPLINLLHAGPHELTLSTLDERLTHTPELSASTQLQLHAELALGHGEDKRASALTISAAAQSTEPRALWARAAVAGRSVGAREYTIEALRQVLLHGDGLEDGAARRELLLLLLRDVDGDAIVREGKAMALDALREQLRIYVAEVPRQRQWARVDGLLWALAGEARADDLAWERLFDVVVDDPLRTAHPVAIAALERAARSGATDTSSSAVSGEGGNADGDGSSDQLAFLSDNAALCQRVLTSAGIQFVAIPAAQSPHPPAGIQFVGIPAAQSPHPPAGIQSEARVEDEVEGPDQDSRQLFVGAATACAPPVRAAALAALVASSESGVRAQLRERILAGPLAVEVEPEHPGVTRTVAALQRPGLSLRVAFVLPLDPVWIVDPGA